MEPQSVISAYPITLSLAFLLGFISRQAGLPPLVGFLVAGFVFHGFGLQADPTIEIVADLGVTLLLFTIGLKLKLKNLARGRAWWVFVHISCNPPPRSLHKNLQSSRGDDAAAGEDCVL